MIAQNALKKWANTVVMNITVKKNKKKKQCIDGNTIVPSSYSHHLGL